MRNMPTRIPKRLVGRTLIDFAADRPREFVELCEKEYDARIARVTDAVLDSGCAVVFLTGPSSSGKTTSARRLADSIRNAGRRSEVISLDDFFVGEGRYPKRPDGADDYECIEALDIPVLQACLRDLAETGECDMPLFDFLTQLPKAERRHVGLPGWCGNHRGTACLQSHSDQSSAGKCGSAGLCRYAGRILRCSRCPCAGYKGSASCQADHAGLSVPGAWCGLSLWISGRMSASRKTNTSRRLKTVPIWCWTPLSATNRDFGAMFLPAHDGANGTGQSACGTAGIAVRAAAPLYPHPPGSGAGKQHPSGNLSAGIAETIQGRKN